MLDAVVDYLPSPIDIPPVKVTDPKRGGEVERSVSDQEPLSAIAFKIVTDPFVGRLAYIRVYSGVLKAGEGVYNSTKDERERVGRLLLMHANQREEIAEIGTGGIAAVVGLKQTFTGDTLCAQDHPVILENTRLMMPVAM